MDMSLLNAVADAQATKVNANGNAPKDKPEGTVWLRSPLDNEALFSFAVYKNCTRIDNGIGKHLNGLLMSGDKEAAAALIAKLLVSGKLVIDVPTIRQADNSSLEDKLAAMGI